MYDDVMAKTNGEKGMDAREGAAVNVAERLAEAHSSMDDEYMRDLRQHFFRSRAR